MLFAFLCCNTFWNIQKWSKGYNPIFIGFRVSGMDMMLLLESKK